MFEKSLRFQLEKNKPVNWKPANLPTVFPQMSQVWTHPVSGAKQSPPKGSGKPTQVMLWRRSGGRSHVKVWSLQLSAVSSGELHLHRWTSRWRASSSGDSLASWRSPPPGASHTGNHTSLILTLLWVYYVVDNQYLVCINIQIFRLHFVFSATTISPLTCCWPPDPSTLGPTHPYQSPSWAPHPTSYLLTLFVETRWWPWIPPSSKEVNTSQLHKPNTNTTFNYMKLNDVVL